MPIMHIRQLSFCFLTAAAGVLVFSAAIWGSPQKDSSDTPPGEISLQQAIAALESRIDRQEKQIDALTQTVATQQLLIDRVRHQSGPAPVQTAATSAEVAAFIPPDAVPEPASAGELAVVQALQQQQNSSIDDLTRKVESVLGNLGGFNFSGDFRFRADTQTRSANADA